MNKERRNLRKLINRRLNKITDEWRYYGVRLEYEHKKELNDVVLNLVEEMVDGAVDRQCAKSNFLPTWR